MQAMMSANESQVGHKVSLVNNLAMVGEVSKREEKVPVNKRSHDAIVTQPSLV